TAYLVADADTPSSFAGYPTTADLRSNAPGYDNGVSGFSVVVAYGGRAGNKAFFAGSATATNFFVPAPGDPATGVGNYAYMYNANYFIAAILGFQTVTAIKGTAGDATTLFAATTATVNGAAQAVTNTFYGGST